ncbi:hypothetical protein Mgra_00010155 [Meloidogyne graminicola]|uniref:Uncharacterized protein n=1 Tax=Meloidogyne graminicola TaxID=189291 RepID=A0A8S9ZAK0_9BILA|nr:hypothetical protein Mgra_00010155 [Meloidogyne graminicola]
MYYFINIYILLIYLTLLLYYTNACKGDYKTGCDNDKNKCCRGTCQHTFDKHLNPQYQCLDQQCINKDNVAFITKLFKYVLASTILIN